MLRFTGVARKGLPFPTRCFTTSFCRFRNPNTPPSDYYDRLGLTKSATAKEIQKAFRDASLTCHPDKFPNDSAKEDKFKSISEAYQTLSDKDLRSKYDSTLSFGNTSSSSFTGNWNSQQPNSSGFNPRDPYGFNKRSGFRYDSNFNYNRPNDPFSQNPFERGNNPFQNFRGGQNMGQGFNRPYSRDSDWQRTNNTFNQERYDAHHKKQARADEAYEHAKNNFDPNRQNVNDKREQQRRDQEWQKWTRDNYTTPGRFNQRQQQEANQRFIRILINCVIAYFVAMIIVNMVRGNNQPPTNDSRYNNMPVNPGAYDFRQSQAIIRGMHSGRDLSGRDMSATERLERDLAGIQAKNKDLEAERARYRQRMADRELTKPRTPPTYPYSDQNRDSNSDSVKTDDNSKTK